MTFKFHPDVAIASAAAVTALVDAAVTAGKIRIYDGVEPANPETAITTQVMLLEYTLPDPAFDAPTNEASGAVAAGNVPAAVPASATGTASWGRVLDGDDNVLWQGSATLISGNGQFKLTSLSIQLGVEVALVEYSYIQPRGY